MAVSRDNLVIGPSSEFFWPLIGAYSRPEEAEIFLGNLFNSDRNTWLPGSNEATKETILTCLLDFQVIFGAYEDVLIASKLTTYCVSTLYIYRTFATVCDRLQSSTC